MVANLAQNVEFKDICLLIFFQRERKGEKETGLLFHLLMHSLVAFACALTGG